MTSLSFYELALRVLQEEKRPLSADEIWQLAQAKGYDRLVNSHGKTPAATISSRIYVHIRDVKDSPFIKMNTRPQRFFLRELMDQSDNSMLSQEDERKTAVNLDYSERQLHPFLTYYAFWKLNAFCKTISHNTSDKKQFGEWVHPDMVGCQFAFKDWRSEVADVGKVIGAPALKLYSFELKKALSFGNLREAFFQAVSNSSWAHEGYLVTAQILTTDPNFTNELRRLSAAFGIGIIVLNLTDPESSDTLFPARTKESPDWDTMDKLAELNPDFREFLTRIKSDNETREVREEKYDRVKKPEELISTLKKG